MLKLNNEPRLLRFLAAVLFSLIGASVAAELTQFELQQLCQGKYMEVIAYPNDPTRFIVCLNDNIKIGMCYTEPDLSNPPYTIQTCFSELKKTCSKDYCPPEPTEDYYDYIKKICSQDSNMFMRLPADDCEHFFMCLGSKGDPIYESCPDGLQYSREYKICMVPLKAGCETLDSMCINKEKGYRFAGTNCYDYYECRLSKPFSQSCAYGQHFDTSTKQCIPAANSNCIENPIRLPKCKPVDNGLYFQHHDCDKFYVCVNNVPFKGQCAQSYYFDPATRQCIKDTKGVCFGN